ncbi:energy transducer TonB [Flavobacterium sp. WC2509]|uniref:energy transducer TonB n=1 Tax=Flavobacterium sp. WC2509 TaxID=3461406 RepID=UPI004043F02D
MKQKLIHTLFLLITIVNYSQSENDKKISLDSSWLIRINLNIYSMNANNETPNENQASYRIIRNYELNKSPYIINDYYKSGVLQCEGKSIVKDILCRQGEFIFYYENGKKRTVANFNYGVQEGKDLEYYENGNKKEERTYIPNSKDGNSKYKIDQFWDINGTQRVIDGNGDYEESTKNYFGSGKLKNGLKDNVWQGWDRNPNNKFTETYENGKLISGTIIDENNIKTAYTVLEKRAQPKNGYQHFHKYLEENISVPNKFDYLVNETFIRYVIDKDGKITDPKIIKSMNPKLDEKAIKILLSYENWIPAEQRGQKIKTTSSLPYSYFILHSK